MLRSRREASISISIPRPGAAPEAVAIVGTSGHGPDRTRDVTVPLPPTITRSMSSPMNWANEAVGTTCQRNSSSFRALLVFELLDACLRQLDANRLCLKHPVVVDRDDGGVDVTRQPVEPGCRRLLRGRERTLGGRRRLDARRDPWRDAAGHRARPAGTPASHLPPTRRSGRRAGRRSPGRRISPPHRRCSPARTTTHRFDMVKA